MSKIFRFWYPAIALTEIEKKTFRLHLLACFFDGIFTGVLALGSYILTKEYLVFDEHVATYHALIMSAFVFSVVGASYTTRRNHRALIIVLGIIGRLLLGLLLLIDNAAFFIGIIFWIHLTHAIFLPSQNMIFKSNYTGKNRGSLFSRSQVVQFLIVAVTSEVCGRILHWRNDVYPYLFLVAGVCGFISFFLYFIMPRDLDREKEIDRSRASGPRKPFYELIFNVLRRDRFFRTYEIIFFIYGCAFMMAITMQPIFLNKVLRANWEEASRVLSVIPTVTMIIMIPLFGRLLDRANVIPVATVAYFLLALWPLCLALSSSIHMAYVGALFFGTGMAGVHVAWMLGAITFAPEDKIQDYMAVHVTLVGVRGMFAPYIGLFIKNYWGFRTSFLTSTCLLLIASLLMLMLARLRTRSAPEPPAD